MFFIYYINRNHQLYSKYIPEDIRQENEVILTTPHIYNACSVFFAKTRLPVYIFSPENISIKVNNKDVHVIKKLTALKNTKLCYSVMGDKDLVSKTLRIAEDVEVIEVFEANDKSRTPYINDFDRDNQYEIDDMRKFTYGKTLYTLKKYTRH